MYIPLVPLYASMGDTKKGRDKKARDTETRQREWELEQARDRADEAEPPDEELDDGDDDADASRECRRRDCGREAAFVVLERYQDETGHGAVEAEAVLCREHTAEESPTNLEDAYADYVFRVEPIPEAGGG